SARGIRLAEAILDRVWSSVVAAYLHDDFTVAADHSRGNGVTIGLAGLNRGLRDGYSHGGAQVPVAEQLCARHRGKGECKDTAERGTAKCGLKHSMSSLNLGRRDAARWGSIVRDLGLMEVPTSAFNVADVIATGECLEGKSDMTFCEHMSAFDPKRTSNGKILAGNHKTEPVPACFKLLRKGHRS